MPDDDNTRFAGDPAEFTFPGQPDFEATKARIRREEAERKRIGEEWLKHRRQGASAPQRAPEPAAPVPSAVPAK